jgi:hypothetical protein
MKNTFVVAATLIFSVSLPWQTQASTFDFTFSGPGVSGVVDLTYGAATDAKYSNAFEVTGISGTISDSNNGLNIVDAAIVSLQPITRDTPEATNLLAPDDFSRFAVATGLDPVSNGFLTFDNLLWPDGSPQTASDYPLGGGFLDIYGLMFNIGGGTVVDLWSNGDVNGPGEIADYGVAVANAQTSLDYVGGGVVAHSSESPEPGPLVLFVIGLFMVLWPLAARRAGKV